MDRFGVRLARAMARRGPLCVGIDPHPSLLQQWGLEVSATGLAAFCATVVEALGEQVAVFKPQSAFFERFGSAGIAVLESTIRQLRSAEALVLLDVKRGDIGSTMQAYAEAYLDPASPLYADAITVSPYLGFGALTPALRLAATTGSGVFVLARTSNPEGGQVQSARASHGRSVAQAVVDEAAGHNAGAPELGDVGVVIGATTAGHEDGALDLSRLHGPVLSPGLGAQGANAVDLEIFANLDGLVVPSYSREVLAQGPTMSGLREAAQRSREACQQVLNVSII